LLHLAHQKDIGGASGESVGRRAESAQHVDHHHHPAGSRAVFQGQILRASGNVFTYPFCKGGWGSSVFGFPPDFSMKKGQHFFYPF
jgi:hypothetical protein